MTERAEDITGLTSYVISRAEEAARAIIARAEEKAERIREEGSNAAQAREEEIVKAGMTEIKKGEKRIISQAKLRLKGETLKAKANAIEEVITAVRERLDRLRRDEKAYLDLLTSLIRDAIAEEKPDSIVVYLSEEDASRYGKELPGLIKEGEGLKEIEIRPGRITGGAIIELPEKRLQMDASFEVLVSELRGRIERAVEEEIFSPLERSEGRNDSQE